MNYDNKRVLDIVSRVGALLREPIRLPDKQRELQLIAIEALSFELLEVRVDWQMLLAEKKSQYLHPKDKDLTEMDRKISLNASLANIERDCSFLTGLEKLVEQRIQLGKALL